MTSPEVNVVQSLRVSRMRSTVISKSVIREFCASKRVACYSDAEQPIAAAKYITKKLSGTCMQFNQMTACVLLNGDIEITWDYLDTETAI